MSALVRTGPDEPYKKEQRFRCPERTRMLGEAMRGRGAGEGPIYRARGEQHLDALRPRKFNQRMWVRRRQQNDAC
jgi:hypothetical protein